jgi:hypothetical protein
MMMTLKYLALSCLMSLAAGVVTADQTNTYYVVSNNPSAQAPYTNWAQAATNIQAAVNVAQSNWGPGTNCIVLVSNGVYRGIALVISNGITLRSVNGAGSTTMRGVASAPVVRMRAEAANAVLEGFSITGSSAFSWGGGIYVAASNSVISRCIVYSNSAYCGGGILIDAPADCLVFHCVITNNYGCQTTNGFGGGVYIKANAGARFVNCLLAGNESVGEGGGLYLYGPGSRLLENCTITGNKAGGAAYGGGVFSYHANSRLMNCIVYDNRGDGVTKDNYSLDVGTLVFTNCCTTPFPLVGGATGTNIVAGAPLFLNAGLGYGLSRSNGNYRLSNNSPCLNVGANQSWMWDACDLDGRARILRRVVDLGAYEFLPLIGTVVQIR